MKILWSALLHRATIIIRTGFSQAKSPSRNQKVSKHWCSSQDKITPSIVTIHQIQSNSDLVSTLIHIACSVVENPKHWYQPIWRSICLHNKHKQVLSSSWDGQLFGHKRHRPKIGGGAGSPSNTMWPEPRPTSVPSSILKHLCAKFHLDSSSDLATIYQRHWQTGQRSDSIGKPFYKRSHQKQMPQK